MPMNTNISQILGKGTLHVAVVCIAFACGVNFGPTRWLTNREREREREKEKEGGRQGGKDIQTDRDLYRIVSLRPSPTN